MRKRRPYQFIRDIIDKNLHRSIKFSVSGWIGFGFVELFTYVFFHLLSLENLVADSAAFIIGVAIEYIINEFWTTRDAGIHTGSTFGVMKRLFKFEILNLAGTGIAIGVQFVLFVFLHLEPLIGNLVGSGIAFPINYYLQMKITWGIEVS